MIASIVTLLIPLWILLGLLFLMGMLALLGRIQNGRYLRPVINVVAKVPLFKRWLQKASEAALERSNPELASAVTKLERSGATRDPMKAQQALSRLTAAERQAYIEAAGQQDEMPEPMNRAQRRAAEKLKKQRR